MPVELEVASSEVPENLSCIVSNERWQELVSLLSVLVPDGFKWTVSDTTPAPEDRIWPWLRLDSNGDIDKVYYFSNGFWLAKYPVPASSPIRELWTQDATALLTYDEGENAAVSLYTGPFWEIDTNYAGRVPIGVGNLPTSGTPVALNTNYGADQVTLAEANIRDHKHFLLANQSASGGSQPTPSQQIAHDGGGYGNENYILQGTNTPATKGLSSNVSGDNAANAAFSIVPPSRGGYWIKRTARTHYRRSP